MKYIKKSEAAKKVVATRTRDAQGRFQKTAPRSFLPTPSTNYSQLFQGIPNAVNGFYRNADEAYQQSQEDATRMLFDGTIQACLQDRFLPTAMRTWHIVGPREWRNEVLKVQETIERIPFLTELLRSLNQNSAWLGRSGILLNKTAWEFDEFGQRWFRVHEWAPIHGDTLVFGNDGRIGYRIGPKYQDNFKTPLTTQEGRIEEITTEERDCWLIHSFQRDPGEFRNPWSAGSAFGLGYRSRLYYIWFMKMRLQAAMMAGADTFGAGGWIIAYFDASNPASAEQMIQAIQNQSNNHIIVIPRFGNNSPEGIEIKEPKGNAWSDIKNAVEYYDNQIRQVICGQTTSANPSLGMGGDTAALYANSFSQRLIYDAKALEETLTRDLVHMVCRMYGFQNIQMRWEFEYPELDKPEPPTLPPLPPIGGKPGDDEPREFRRYSKWEESEHPRADDGRFGDKSGEHKQKRAAPGGEYGPNGEWYKGGAWIATTELPKKAKAAIAKAGSGKVPVGDGTYVVPEPGKMSIVDKVMGKGIHRDGSVNEQYMDYIQASEKTREMYKELGEKYKAGEKWVNVNDYTSLAGFSDIARLINAKMPIPGAILDELPKEYQTHISKYTEPKEFSKISFNKWEEDKHPRAEDGKFGEGSGDSDDGDSDEGDEDIESRHEREIGELQEFHDEEEIDLGAEGIETEDEIAERHETEIDEFNSDWNDEHPEEMEKQEAIDNECIEAANEKRKIEAEHEEAAANLEQSIAKEVADWKKNPGSAEDAQKLQASFDQRREDLDNAKRSRLKEQDDILKAAWKREGEIDAKRDEARKSLEEKHAQEIRERDEAEQEARDRQEARQAEELEELRSQHAAELEEQNDNESGEEQDDEDYSPDDEESDDEQEEDDSNDDDLSTIEETHQSETDDLESRHDEERSQLDEDHENDEGEHLEKIHEEQNNKLAQKHDEEENRTLDEIAKEEPELVNNYRRLKPEHEMAVKSWDSKSSKVYREIANKNKDLPYGEWQAKNAADFKEWREKNPHPMMTDQGKEFERVRSALYGIDTYSDMLERQEDETDKLEKRQAKEEKQEKRDRPKRHKAEREALAAKHAAERGEHDKRQAAERSELEGRSKKFAKGNKWITVNGTHVQVDGKGNIVKGPSALANRSKSKASTKAKPAAKAKPKAKPKAKGNAWTVTPGDVKRPTKGTAAPKPKAKPAAKAKPKAKAAPKASKTAPKAAPKAKPAAKPAKAAAKPAKPAKPAAKAKKPIPDNLWPYASLDREPPEAPNQAPEAPKANDWVIHGGQPVKGPEPKAEAKPRRLRDVLDDIHRDYDGPGPDNITDDDLNQLEQVGKHAAAAKANPKAKKNVWDTLKGWLSKLKPFQKDGRWYALDEDGNLIDLENE